MKSDNLPKKGKVPNPAVQPKDEHRYKKPFGYPSGFRFPDKKERK